MSDSSGFAVTPPRADSDATTVRPVDAPQSDTGTYESTAARDNREPRTSHREPRTANPEPRIPDSGPTAPPAPESELMIARGDDRDGPDAEPREPRIERYRER
jgi:hypothetical protein